MIDRLGTASDREIAEELGLSFSVRRKRFLLGIPPAHPPAHVRAEIAKWTPNVPSWVFPLTSILIPWSVPRSHRAAQSPRSRAGAPDRSAPLDHRQPAQGVGCRSRATLAEAPPPLHSPQKLALVEARRPAGLAGERGHRLAPRAPAGSSLGPPRLASGDRILKMERRGQAVDRHGRTWTGAIVHKSEAAAEDFRFWFVGMTPEERVLAVGDCLLSALKARASMLSRDYEEFLESLNAHGVRYLVVGAHAVALYARPRATKDLDIYIEPTQEDAEQVWHRSGASSAGPISRSRSRIFSLLTSSCSSV